MAAMLDYLRLIRLPALFSALSNILAAYFIGAQGSYSWEALALLLITSAALYSAGMVLNDCYDIEEDRRERPARPLAAGRIALRRGWWLGWSLLLVGLITASLLGMLALGISILLAISIVLYNVKAKHGDAGPYVMGLCRYLNWLLGFAPFLSSPLFLLLPLPLFCYIVGLTFLSKIETTSSITTGRVEQRSITYCAIGIIISLLLVVVLMIAGLLDQWWMLIPFMGGALFLLWCLYLLSKHFSSISTQSMMKRLLLGIIPFDAMLVFASGLWWGGVIILMLLVPGRLLARKIYMT